MFFAEFENMYLSGPRMWSKLIHSVGTARHGPTINSADGATLNPTVVRRLLLNLDEQWWYVR